MANTLTNLIRPIMQAVDIVSRELVGLIPAVTLNATADNAAVGQVIRFPVTPVSAITALTPAATGPDPAALTIGSDTMTIARNEGSTFYWTGDEQLGLSDLYETILRNQFAQAMRTLCNAVEADLAATHIYASRAYGTAGNAPFATAGNYTDAAQVHKILADNGAPMSDLQMVINTSAGANLRGLQGGRGVNLEGTPDLLRRGILQDIHGFSVRESAQIKTIGKGTTTGVTTSGATTTNRKGMTTVTVDTAASSGVLAVTAGDVIAIADTPGLYVVNAAKSAAHSQTAQAITINAPGLLANVADGKAVTVRAADHSAMLAFPRSAIHALIRQPAMPEGGDGAADVRGFTDPVSGITFQVAMYRQYRRVAYEVGLAWGVKLVKPEHVAVLLG
jgi:hypothetical protein